MDSDSSSELSSELSSEPAQHYDIPRAPSPHELRHPLLEPADRVLGHTTLDLEPDTLLVEHAGQRRVLELFDDYTWVQHPRTLSWGEFLGEEAGAQNRQGWAVSIHEKLGAYGLAVPEPQVWVARHRDLDADWLLALEF